MITRYEVMLGGVPLSSIDETVYITDIAYQTPVITQQYADIAGRDGQLQLSRKTQSLSVSVSFEIHERSISRRMQILQQIQRWAVPGGTLTTNDRPEQRLHVVCETPPVIGSAMRWTQTLMMTFTAYALPFWEDENPAVITITGNDSKTAYIPGLVGCRVSGTITNSGTATITTATITCGTSVWKLTGLSLAAGKALTFGHDDDGHLYILQNGVSALACRSADSNDELTMDAGTFQKIVIATSSGKSTAVLQVRGLYL